MKDNLDNILHQSHWHWEWYDERIYLKAGALSNDAVISAAQKIDFLRMLQEDDSAFFSSYRYNQNWYEVKIQTLCKQHLSVERESMGISR